mmetsp:Transcript_21604/g.32168  ORF Transcript_21604/g.32168 Transcript_21604/m.32168 type:complete len:220 (+) Transcript_21604:120-779(+)
MSLLSVCSNRNKSPLPYKSRLRRTVSDHVARGNLFRKGLSCDHLTNHGSEDTHHSSTSLVDFHVQLVLEFFTLQHIGDERTSVTAAVVSAVVSCRPDGKLTYTAEEEDLSQSSKWNREQSVDAVGDVRESDSHFLREVSWEFNVGVVEKHTNNGNHRNTSMLTFDGTTAFETGVVCCVLGGGILRGVQPSKRIVKSQRSGDSDGRVQRVNGTESSFALL